MLLLTVELTLSQNIRSFSFEQPFNMFYNRFQPKSIQDYKNIPLGPLLPSGAAPQKLDSGYYLSSLRRQGNMLART